MHPVDRFRFLHQGSEAFVLVNVWDGASALLAQQAGAQALGTSSASLAWSLGWPDGQQLPWAELKAAVVRLLRVARVPLSVDIEAGYGSEPEAVAARVRELAELGVAGINIEDGLAPAEQLAAKLRAIRQRLGKRPLFLNARCDSFLLAVGEPSAREGLALARAQAYAAAGADGVFLPGLADLATAGRLAQAVPAALNLMWLPGLPPRQALPAAGVHRLSLGPASFLGAYSALAEQLRGWCALGQPPEGWQPRPDYAGWQALCA
ncbi:isocitrate lyase/PEP mutase family protein [Inhella proteolytica]|uniref:Isocitrate lyase/phosphoenolpyruvate mutase family protein n=1 Tax=Inhella proteolytica TaxID=2795029 RepID=A0A931J3M0_9BURK|nr:isocitrate lyase/phosphoenolpyruvate mutase family protein [Inhella proteolytica]MBH9578979.1 isocitrate lyase/phosphoenolpyruvate mutase family protein [Inhella proteolytica]